MSEKDYFAYFETPEFKELLTRYEAMRTCSAGAYFDAEELTDIAEYYATHTDMKKANEAIDYALTMHPGSTDPLIFKARNRMLDGNLEEAYRTAESIPDQEDREVIFLYAELMINEGRTEEAKQLMKGRLYKKDDTPKERHQTTQDIIELFYDYSCTEEATQIAEEEAQLAQERGWKRKDLHSTFDVLAGCHINEKRFGKAVDIYNQLLDEAPYDANLWMRLGETYCSAGNPNKAIDAFNYALAISQDYKEAYYQIGKCFYVLGNYKEALRYYRRSIDKQFAPTLSNYTCGMLEVKMGLYPEAIRHLRKAYELTGEMMPNSFQILYNLALCYAETNEIDRARHFYKKAEELMPTYEGLLILKARIMPNDEEESLPPLLFN